MTTLTQKTIHLKSLDFQMEMGIVLTSNSVYLNFETDGDDVVECRLQLELNVEQYQQIEQRHSFNITPEIKGPHIGNPFQPEYPISLQATLRPDLLPTLLAYAPTAEAIASYLPKLNQRKKAAQAPASSTKSESPLHTENWLCLSVKQQQETEEVGFTTFWHDINPALLNNPNTTSDQLAEGITNFVKTWTEANLAEATQTATNQFLQGITETFGELLDGTLESPNDSEDEPNAALFPTVTHFFEQEDWPFVKIAETTALRLNFRGDNGQWSCYTKVNEDQQTFLFYSICPIPAPEETHPAIAEFITRANYGLILGNFELDYTDGEIRYKTSLDTEGDTLTTCLIQNLVYTNVMMMDRYLPGLLSVLEQGATPEQAIQLAEQDKS